jgi:hypothetical protein
MVNETPKSTNFYIRMIGWGSGGAGVKGDVLIFEIWDPANRLSAKYKFVGTGLGMGSPITISATEPWNLIRVKTPREVSGFGTPMARFTSIGGGPLCDNYLNLLGLGDMIYLNIKTTFEVGGGLSSSVGQFEWDPATVVRAAYSGAAAG